MTLSLYDIPLRQIDGSPGRLADYRGDVLLVVNIASKCDLTPQYVRLESLYQNKRDTGLGVPGLSANNFNGQEPDSDSEIANLCLANYNVHFPLFSEISVPGRRSHPVRVRLTAAIGDGPFRERLKGYGVDSGNPVDGLWNFEKFPALASIVSRTNAGA